MAAEYNWIKRRENVGWEIGANRGRGEGRVVETENGIISRAPGLQTEQRVTS